MPTTSEIKKFLTVLQNFYLKNKRSSLPWRKTRDVYRILLSEIMLQQTQVSRVLLKYQEFIEKYPTAHALAQAPLRDVLIMWQGLGYNRRAKFLHEATKRLATASAKEISDYSFLTSLPGVGQSTAGAILAFTKNKPVIFIETNIRAVLLYHFFADAVEKISDTEITPILTKLISETTLSPRDFYYALYDYGTHIKTVLGKNKKTLHSKSTHYVKQSAFSGSRRQLRAFILKMFLELKNEKLLLKKVKENLPKSLEKYSKEDIVDIVNELKTEGFFK